MMGSSSPPASNTDAMKTLGDLLGVVADPVAYNERLTGLKEAEASARAANEELKATRAEADAARQALATEKAQLDKDRSTFAQFQTSQNAGLEQRQTALNQAADSVASQRKKLETDTAAATAQLDGIRAELGTKTQRLAADTEVHKRSVADREAKIKKDRATADLLLAHSETLRTQHAAVTATQNEAERARAELRTTLDKILAAQK